jgi:hypothetical protein
MKDSTSKSGTIIALALALFMYNLLPFWPLPAGASWWQEILKWTLMVARYSAAVWFFLFTLEFKPFVWAVLRRGYIAGTYVGVSEDVRRPSAGEQHSGREKHKEKIVITQSLYSATIAGKSFWRNDDETPDVSYEGVEFMRNKNSATFAIMVFTPQPEYGILRIDFNGPGISGTYLSTHEANRTPAKFSVTREKGLFPW